MLPIIFFVLLAWCLGLWVTGFPMWFVFIVALATWVAFYFVVYPKIRAYKEAMGIDDRLNEAEATGWQWLKLKLAGFKVLILGVLGSSLPFVADLVQWASGQDLSFAYDLFKPEHKQTVTFAFGALVFVLPMMVQWLHSHTAATAAETQPKDT